MTLESDLFRGVAEPIILRLVSERAMYGYEMIKVVNERSGGAFAWREGTLYPCLHRLEAAGLLAGEWRSSPNGRERKYYRITRRGTAALRRRTAEWSALAPAVNALLLGPA